LIDFLFCFWIYPYFLFGFHLFVHDRAHVYDHDLHDNVHIHFRAHDGHDHVHDLGYDHDGRHVHAGLHGDVHRGHDGHHAGRSLFLQVQN